MNKVQFSRYFKENIEPEIQSTDKPALRQAWNDHIDGMVKNGELKDNARDWSHPARFYTDSERAVWPSSNKLPRKPKLKKGDFIQVIGRRWFDGNNTYHSVNLLINGVNVFYQGFTYGYGSQYEITALNWVKNNYTMPKGFEDTAVFWHLREAGITVNNSVSDVSRKKDL